MIHVHATIPIDPDRRGEAIELAQELAADSRAEAGVIDYRVGTDVEDPSIFRFVEQYEDEAALATHGETEHFQAFQEEIVDLLAGEPELTQYHVDDVSDVAL